ncbi:cell adhesion molecule 3 isoform X2 [Oncorhynchus mykiss]|uniref:cell adhesion molecule 3 isoform X2 n=1 Tax=Oncorhynchus mykiss TaxID=8022 RepID=UPI001878E892|nr:cell adhesion molecule 3 isoform X2 [Oncorhynchus mykiss]XP_046178179.1 cell adhesion molecule 3-like isoform X3 [Oncorhynchus gorbuscha]
MAFPSYLVPNLWTLSLLTLLAASVQSNFIVFDDDPLQPVTQDETASVGGMVTLTCRVAASDNSSLQWSNTAQQTLYFGEKRALRDNRIQLNRSTGTELSITIGNVQLSDEGEYTCSIFTMPVRTARATVTVLGVPDKPQISGYEDTVQEGGKVTLTCTSSGSKPPAKLRWYRNQEELTGRPDVVETNPDEATYTVISELTLTVGRSDDNTLIGCAVDHPSLSPGEKWTEQPIRVLFTPDVTIQPQNDLPREGEKFIIQCIGNGNPKPTSYVWQKKDGELPLMAKVDGSFLLFEMLNKSDNGVYLCQADNGIGKMQGEYTLLVQDGPDNIADPTAMSTSSGVDHAVIGGVVAVIVFILLCLLIVLGRYLIRHKGTYLTHEAKGCDDAPDADTAIINAEGGHSGAEDKKEYFI